MSVQGYVLIPEVPASCEAVAYVDRLQDALDEFAPRAGWTTPEGEHIRPWVVARLPYSGEACGVYEVVRHDKRPSSSEPLSTTSAAVSSHDMPTLSEIGAPGTPPPKPRHQLRFVEEPPQGLKDLIDQALDQAGR